MATTKLVFKTPGGDLDFSKFAPGFDSEVARRWGRHPIPGQRGQLLEDLNDGSLSTSVQCVFFDLSDYNQYMDALAKYPRGQLVHSRRGTRRSALTKVHESVRWTQRGEATIVDLTFEDAALSEADQFKAGPAAQAQQVRAQGAAAIASTVVQTARINARRVDAANLRLRQLIQKAAALVAAVAGTSRSYADAAMAAWQSGIFNPGLPQQLRALPAQVELASLALRTTGPTYEVQAAVVALEMMLAGANGLDAAIRASSPVPIETEITRPGGQSIYAFVQQHYSRKGKTPAQLRELVRLILSWNRLRRVDLIPMGELVLRPALA